MLQGFHLDQTKSRIAYHIKQTFVVLVLSLSSGDPVTQSGLESAAAVWLLVLEEGDGLAACHLVGLLAGLLLLPPLVIWGPPLTPLWGEQYGLLWLWSALDCWLESGRSHGIYKQGQGHQCKTLTVLRKFCKVILSTFLIYNFLFVLFLH